MGYKALYRKYRPKTFNDVVGQDAIVQTIKNAIKENKVSHAYLLTGPRGSGKTSIAKLFGKAVNCLDSNDGSPCNNCKNCLLIENNGVSDIIEIDAASNNGVDEIRELRSKVNLLPSECKYKVYIIDEVHMLSTGAFNALLKTLEEPPAHVVFILATTEPHKLPITIISRCQRFDFKRISQDAVEKKIREIVTFESIDINSEAIALIAKLSDGGLRDAIGLLDQSSMYSSNKITLDDINNIVGMISKEEMIEFLINIAEGSTENVLNSIHGFEQRGKNLVKFVEESIYVLKNAMICNSAPKYLSTIETEISMYEAICNKLTSLDIYRLITTFDDLLNKMLTSNYQQLLLEVAVLHYINSRMTINSNTVRNAIDLPISINKSTVLNLAVDEKKDDVIQKESTVVSSAPLEAEKVTTNKAKDSDVVLMKKKIVTNMQKIDEITNLRINNALAEASKDELQLAKKRWEQLNETELNNSLELVVGMLQDSEIKVAGSKYIIIVFKYQSAADCINENLVEAEMVISKLMGADKKIFALSEKRWNDERALFIVRTKNNEKLLIQAEPEHFYIEIDEKYERDESSSMIEMLGDIVEMK